MTAANKLSISMPKYLTYRQLAGITGLSILMLLVSACVSTDSLQPNRGGTSFIVRGKTYEQIWNAATKAMSTDMQIVESHKPSGAIKSRVGSAPNGKVVGFFIQPTTPSADYTITVVSKKWALREDLSARDWEPSVIEDFKDALNTK